jgi:N-methylhydantoinase A/oxoprolinase/acetone carboxylase beta subunit
VTDANLVIGYLNPDYFNGGAMTLDVEAAKTAIKKHVADPLGLSVGEAAWGIHAVANSSMETAMRVISVERGRDPRQYALVGFGGAGPLHAARLARALGVPRLIVPKGAGVGSAVGLLNADSRVDVSMMRIMKLEAGCTERLRQIFTELTDRARRDGTRSARGRRTDHFYGVKRDRAGLRAQSVRARISHILSVGSLARRRRYRRVGEVTSLSHA